MVQLLKNFDLSANSFNILLIFDSRFFKDFHGNLQ